MKKFIAILLLVALFVGSELQSQNVAKPKLRTWKDATGGFSVEAIYVSANDGKVQLKKRNNSLITLSIKRLSKRDQEWIVERLAKMDRGTNQPRPRGTGQDGQKQGKRGGNPGKQSNQANAFDEYAPTRSAKDEMVALASKGFTWLTGSPADNDVSSVGKDAQFFGFVSLRYQSKRTVQRGPVGRAFFALLTDDQRSVLISAAHDQHETLQQFHLLRQKVLRELERLLYTGLEVDMRQLQALAEQYGELDAELGLHQARAFATVNKSLTRQQHEQLKQMRRQYVAGQSNSGQELARQQRKVMVRDATTLSEDEFAQLEDMCAKAFTWLTGTSADNETLPLGKPAQFFGFVSLRLKSNHSVSRAGISRMFYDLLSSRQQSVISRTATQQHDEVDEYLAKRRKLLREFERLRDAAQCDEKEVVNLGADLGWLDVQIALLQAKAYTEVRTSLREEQVESLMDIRSQYVLESTDLAELAPLERGKRLFFLCASCHSPQPGKPHVGPPLHGVVGRQAASMDGFKYSPAIKAKASNGLVWTADALNKFLAQPQRFVPSTNMGFKGLLHEDDRTALIEYLKTLKH